MADGLVVWPDLRIIALTFVFVVLLESAIVTRVARLPYAKSLCACLLANLLSVDVSLVFPYLLQQLPVGRAQVVVVGFGMACLIEFLVVRLLLRKSGLRTVILATLLSNAVTYVIVLGLLVRSMYFLSPEFGGYGSYGWF